MAQQSLIESVTEESIALLIDRFYAEVRRDPVLAPVFVAIFVGLGAWSLLPLLVAGGLEHE